MDYYNELVPYVAVNSATSVEIPNCLDMMPEGSTIVIVPSVSVANNYIVNNCIVYTFPEGNSGFFIATSYNNYEQALYLYNHITNTATYYSSASRPNYYFTKNDKFFSIMVSSMAILRFSANGKWCVYYPQLRQCYFEDGSTSYPLSVLQYPSDVLVTPMPSIADVILLNPLYFYKYTDSNGELVQSDNVYVCESYLPVNVFPSYITDSETGQRYLVCGYSLTAKTKKILIRMED